MAYVEFFSARRVHGLSDALMQPLSLHCKALHCTALNITLHCTGIIHVSNYTALNSVLQGITLIPEMHTEDSALPHCISMTHQLAALNIALIIALHRTNSALLCASLNVTLHTHY